MFFAPPHQNENSAARADINIRNIQQYEQHTKVINGAYTSDPTTETIKISMNADNVNCKPTAYSHANVPVPTSGSQIPGRLSLKRLISRALYQRLLCPP